MGCSERSGPYTQGFPPRAGPGRGAPGNLRDLAVSDGDGWDLEVRTGIQEEKITRAKTGKGRVLWEDGGDGYRTPRMQLMPSDRTLKNGGEGKFCYMFYHSKKMKWAKSRWFCFIF